MTRPESPAATDTEPARETLSNAEISAITGLGRDKVQELLRARVIPNVKAGRRYLVTRAHLDAFLRGETQPR